MHMQLLKKEVSAAYESYDFHVLYHAIHNFCSIEMSSYYLDILKDRLYAYKADSFERRSAQTAMYEIMLDLVVMIAPVLRPLVTPSTLKSSCTPPAKRWRS
mgnify:CR=1 FL=1